MLTLRPVIHNAACKSWCGIVALSAITGNPTEHSRQFFREVLDDKKEATGTKRVLKGIYTHEMLAALKGMCLDYQKIEIPRFLNGEEITLAHFLHYWKPAQGKLALITIPRHFLVASSTEIIDSSWMKPIPYWRYPRLNEEITSCYEISDNSLGDL